MREIYHFPIITINIVRTKGNAGYRVWKFAGGQGDHEISLPFGSVWETNFLLGVVDVFVANPLLIFIFKI